MKQISGKDFSALLQRLGWLLVRIHGSHHIHMKEGRPERISVPVHGNKPLNSGLLKHFMKIADIDENDL